LLLISAENRQQNRQQQNKEPAKLNVYAGFVCWVVELEGIEPSSRDATAGAFYMFISVCCRDEAGTEITLLHP